MAKSKKGSKSKSRSPRGRSGRSKSPRSSANRSSVNMSPMQYKNPDPVAQFPEPDAINNSMSSIALFILIILYVVAITINYLALMWLLKLDEIDCKCSDSWMRYYIKYFLYAYFVMLILAIIIDIYFLMSGESFRDSSIRTPFIYISLIFNMFGFANMIIAIVYIDQLKKLNCECSDDIKREVYWYYNIVKLSFWALILLLGIASLILMR